jgi:hypothetical protein
LLYQEHVLQANEGCDLDFLRGKSPVMTSLRGPGGSALLEEAIS